MPIRKKRSDEAMSKLMKRILIIGAFITLGIMYALDLASSGIERIQGPVQGQTAPPVWTQTIPPQQLQYPQQPTYPQYGQAPQTGEQPQQMPQQAQTPQWGWPQTGVQQPVQSPWAYVPVPQSEQPFQPVLDVPVKQAPVDRLADKTAGLLQTLSRGGIRFVVSLFGSIAE